MPRSDRKVTLSPCDSVWTIAQYSWNREPDDDSDDQGKGSDRDDHPQRDPDCDWHALSLHVRSNVSPRPANKGWTAQYPYFETRTKSERTAVSGSMKSARRPGFQTARPSQSCIMEETVMVAPLKKSDPTCASDYVQTTLVSDIDRVRARPKHFRGLDVDDVLRKL